MCMHVLDGLTCLAGISDSLCDASIPAVRVEQFYIEPRLAVTWLGGQTHPLIPKVNSDTRPVIWLLRQLIAIEYCLDPGMPMHDTVFAAMLLGRKGCEVHTPQELFRRNIGRLPRDALPTDTYKELCTKQFLERCALTMAGMAGRSERTEWGHTEFIDGLDEDAGEVGC